MKQETVAGRRAGIDVGLTALLALTATLALTLTACGTFELDLQAGATETLTPVESTVPPTQTGEAAVPTETPPAVEVTSTAPAAAVLPQAAYFLSPADGQIWRIAADGRTLTQITHEREAISEYDVSPVDHALVYVTENLLIRTDAEGGGRTVLLTGPALTGAESEAITSVIHQPVWSPDGAQVAFGLNGVNLIPATGGTPQLIQPSDPVPQSRTEARFYRPYAYSPDGTRLVMQVFFWQEGLVYAVKDLAADGQPVREFNLCCEPAWSRDGQSLYFYGAEADGMNAPGLWKVNASTGETVTLIEGRTDASTTVNTVLYPSEAPDGTLYFWMSTQTPDANYIYPIPPAYQMYRLPAGAAAGTAPTLVRPESFPVAQGGGIWWTDGPLGALVSQVRNAEVPTIGGALVWLPVEGGAAVDLPAEGVALKW